MTSLAHGYHRDHLQSCAMSHATGRRHELDWLRVLIIVGLIPFHVIGLFASAIYMYVRGGETGIFVNLFSDFFGLWPMSLLFLVSGASTWFALARRTTRQYTRERLLRLCVPFLFATLVIIPIQVYAVITAFPQLVTLNVIPNPGLSGNESYIQFYPIYLKGYAYFLTHFSSMGEIVFWGHLWFIPRLLLYALAGIPLFLWLRGTAGKRLIQRFATLFAVPGSVMLLGLALALPRVLAAAAYRVGRVLSPDAGWEGFNLWAQLGVFLVCFVAGYIIYASPTLLLAVQRDGPIGLPLGIILFALLQTPIGHFASVTEISPAGILMTLLRAESEWFLVAGVLSIGLQFFTFSNKILNYLNDAAYPLYVLHMPILVLVGLSMMAWDISTGVALVLNIMATLALTLGLYEFVIRRVALLRLFFGLKPARTQPAGNAQPLVRDLRHGPDGHDDNGVAQPVGKR